MPRFDPVDLIDKGADRIVKDLYTAGLATRTPKAIIRAATGFSNVGQWGVERDAKPGEVAEISRRQALLTEERLRALSHYDLEVLPGVGALTAAQAMDWLDRRFGRSTDPSVCFGCGESDPLVLSRGRRHRILCANCRVREARGIALPVRVSAAVSRVV